MKTVRIPYLALLLMLACTFAYAGSRAAGKPPTKSEVYDLLLNQLKQRSVAANYLDYRMDIDKFELDAAAQQCAVKDLGNVTCYTIKIDRTEYNMNQSGAYIAIFTNDVYHFYRDTQNKLAIANHAPGQVRNIQRHPTWGKPGGN